MKSSQRTPRTLEDILFSDPTSIRLEEKSGVYNDKTGFTFYFPTNNKSIPLWEKVNPKEVKNASKLAETPFFIDAEEFDQLLAQSDNRLAKKSPFSQICQINNCIDEHARDIDIKEALDKLHNAHSIVFNLALLVLQNRLFHFPDKDFRQLILKADPRVMTTIGRTEEFLVEAARIQSPETFKKLLDRLDIGPVSRVPKHLLSLFTSLFLFQPIENIVMLFKALPDKAVKIDLQEYWNAHPNFQQAVFALFEKLSQSEQSLLPASFFKKINSFFAPCKESIGSHLSQFPHLSIFQPLISFYGPISKNQANEVKQESTSAEDALLVQYRAGNLLAKLDDAESWLSFAKKLREMEEKATPAYKSVLLSKFAHTRLGDDKSIVGELFLKDKSEIVARMPAYPLVSTMDPKKANPAMPALRLFDDAMLRAYTDNHPHISNQVFAEFKTVDLVGIVVGNDTRLNRAIARDRAKYCLGMSAKMSGLPILFHDELAHSVKVYTKAEQETDKATLLADLKDIRAELWQHTWKLGFFGGKNAKQNTIQNAKGYVVETKKVPHGVASYVDVVDQVERGDCSLSDALTKIKTIFAARTGTSSSRDADTTEQYEKVVRRLGL